MNKKLKPWQEKVAHFSKTNPVLHLFVYLTSSFFGIVFFAAEWNALLYPDKHPIAFWFRYPIGAIVVFLLIFSAILFAALSWQDGLTLKGQDNVKK